MKSTICFETELAGFKIALIQTGKNTFTVVYGLQTFKKMGYQSAAKELGECIMHALNCEGKINEGGR
jgi:hypothetical protein